MPTFSKSSSEASEVSISGSVEPLLPAPSLRLLLEPSEDCSGCSCLSEPSLVGSESVSFPMASARDAAMSLQRLGFGGRFGFGGLGIDRRLVLLLRLDERLRWGFLKERLEYLRSFSSSSSPSPRSISISTSSMGSLSGMK